VAESTEQNTCYTKNMSLKTIKKINVANVL